MAESIGVRQIAVQVTQAHIVARITLDIHAAAARRLGPAMKANAAGFAPALCEQRAPCTFRQIGLADSIEAIAPVVRVAIPTVSAG
ncbi:MAG TPA: hypothetical protein VF493_01510 [Terriglobales bacterium]